MPVAFSHVAVLWLLSVTRAKLEKKKVFSQLTTAATRQKRWVPHHNGQQFKHGDRRRETWKKAGCFPLLRRITRLKCVNSVITSVNSLPKQGFPQVGPWHHVGATMEITLDKNWSFIGSVGNWIPIQAKIRISYRYWRVLFDVHRRMSTM